MSTFWRSMREAIETIEVIEQQIPEGFDPRPTDTLNDFAGFFIEDGKKAFSWRMRTVPMSGRVSVSCSIVESRDQVCSLQLTFVANEEKWWAELSVPPDIDERDGLVQVFQPVRHLSKTPPSLLSSKQQHMVTFEAEISDEEAWKLLDEMLVYFQ